MSFEEIEPNLGFILITKMRLLLEHVLNRVQYLMRFFNKMGVAFAPDYKTLLL